jgi:DNA-binding MarR family transcriptional regulator
MKDTNLDRILENMFFIMLVIHTKILKMDLSGCPDSPTRLHMAVMGELTQTSMTMSELAKALMMTKPQLTHLVEQLVTAELVERQPDANDRRVINLALTEKGRILGKDMKQRAKENTKKILSTLTPEELSQMASALEILRNTVGKL